MQDVAAAPPLRLRAATAADVPALATIYTRCARELGPQVYGTEQVAAWAGFGGDDAGFRDYVLSAETAVALGQADEPIGFCGFSLHGSVAEVHSLYVQPDHGRRGIGRALLADCLERATAAGATRFEAWATPFSRPLFQRAGLTLVQAVREEFKGVMFERWRVGSAAKPVLP